MSGERMPRRAFLRGLGTSIALPAMEAFRPALAGTHKVATEPPKRLAFVYVPNGIVMERWTPAATGTHFEMPEIMQPLEPFRNKLLVLSGLTHNTGRALGDGPGDHARAAATFLTGVHPRKTAGADICLDVSFDQVVARSTGRQTRLASLELGCEHGRLAGSCDSGYSCAYSNSISWRGASTPMPPEVNPRLVFERLFGDIAGHGSTEARQRRMRYRKSILDFVLEDTQQLSRELGAADRRKLDEYLTAVRDIESRIQRVESSARDLPPDLSPPPGIPVEFHEHARLMFDLMAVAFQTDSTRVITFMMGREGSNRVYREIGVTDAHHGLTHHRGNVEWIEKIARINRYHVEQFARFLQRLDSIPEGEGTLLDHCLIVYGSSISDGNRHWHHNLPIVLAGGAGSQRRGRHIRYPQETPLTNLYVSLMQRMGLPEQFIGDSTGPLADL